MVCFKNKNRQKYIYIFYNQSKNRQKYISCFRMLCFVPYTLHTGGIIANRNKSGLNALIAWA